MKDIVVCIFFLCIAKLSYTQNESTQIVIGAVHTGSELEFYQSWKVTFEVFFATYFKSKSEFSGVIFSLKLFNLSSVFDAVSKGELDFVFANPSVYSCLDIEFSGEIAKLC